MLRKTSGFTLVELAIAMTIIGLIIGGILKGQELINNARRQKVIRDIQSFETALVTFQDKYAQIPGDFSRAAERLPGCTLANFCSYTGFDGDGNNMIGQPIAVIQDLEISYGNDPWAKENTLFWKHLALADLITGIDPGANAVFNAGFPETTGEDIGWGVSHPMSALGGGYEVVATNNNLLILNVQPFERSLQIRLQHALGNMPNQFRTVTDNGSDARPIRWRDAEIIDHKFDDGHCEAGLVRGACADPTQTIGCGWTWSIAGATNYDIMVGEEEAGCTMFFSITP